MSEKNEIQKVTANTTGSILEELRKAYDDIPFSESEFQITRFVIGSSMTPERAYKQIGLELMNCITNIADMLEHEQIRQINVEELHDKYEKETNPFEKRKIKLKIDNYSKSKEHSEWLAKKSLKEQLNKANLLYSHFKKMPKFTNKQYEIGEERYFLESLNRQANGLTGAKDSLINLYEDYRSLKLFSEESLKLEKKELSLEDINNLYNETMNNLKTNEIYMKLESQNDKLENKE